MNAVSLELALRDALDDGSHMEDVAVETLQEAVAWRSLALVALAFAQEQKMRGDLLERRIRQVLGYDPWHTAEEMEA